MSKCKRALSLLLVMLMMLSLFPVSVFAEGEKDTYSVVINYVFKDTQQTAAPSWTATVSRGSSLTQNVTSPAVVGYTPEQDVVKLNYTNIQEDFTVKVEYSPALVNFTVRHYLQNVDDDGYAAPIVETKRGYTEAAVGDTLANTYPGFTALLYDTTTKIAADGSTVVEIYYDRNYYLLSLDLDGGYGADPVYARYGAAVSVAEPEKPGYTFVGWNPTKPDTMPAENRTLTAQWTPEDAVKYTVVFWYENADDAEYSYAGSVTQSAAPGTSVSSGDFQTTDFTGRDANHFTYNGKKTETVTVAGDGSTVVNVYFSRNTYTLTFKNGNTTVATISAKWNAKISDKFSKAPFNTTYNGRAWECTESSKYDYALQTLDRMPGFDATFKLYDKSSSDKKTIYYYVQKVGTTVSNTSWPTSTANFDLLKQVDTYFNYATYDEEYHEILGFTRYSKQVSGFTGFQNGWSWADNAKRFSNNTLYLYYLRNSYTLKFFNHGSEVTNKQASVQYEAPLGSYDFVPDYPAGLETNAYEFGGWYLNPECTGEEYKLDEHTMPAGDLMLYAKWTPKTHTVRTFLTEDVVATGAPLNTWENVAHRSTIAKPDAPTNGNYTFVGWFYKDNGVEKAFDFSMAITKDLDLYAKWSSNVLVEYTIKYQYEGEDIADVTKGSALAGNAKTFDAKGGSDLYDDYREGYFPLTASHSLTLDIEGKNEYIFVYVQKDAVPYTVKYVDAATGEELHTAKTVTDNRSAIVTEKYVAISGYVPDAAYKRLVVSADEPEKNVITFYYTKDEEHALVTINYWTQTADGSTYVQYGSSTTYTGDLNKEYKETPKDIEGFKYNAAPQNPLTGHIPLASGVLTEAGLELNLYYDRISYAYTVRYVDADDNTDIDTTQNESSSALFGATVTGYRKDFDGYMPADNEPDQKQITIGTGKNEIIFYYYKCFYVGHVQTTLTDTITYRLLPDRTYNLTSYVPDNYLYGGAFSDAACGENNVQTFTNDENALGFHPEKGKTYYIWEVDQKYLIPKTTAVWRHVDGKETVTRLYLMTPIDRLLYSEVGFDIVGDQTPRKSEQDKQDVAYGRVNVTKNDQPYQVIYVENGVMNITKPSAPVPESVDEGYIGMYKLSDDEFNSFQTRPFSFQPYWVTLDGIKVTGTDVRTCTYKTAPATSLEISYQTVGSKQTVVKPESSQSLTFVAAYSYDGDPNAAEAPDTLTITVHDGDSTTAISAAHGEDLTGKLAYAGADGKLFAGWFTDEACTVPANLSDVQEDMTVYAKYVSDSLLRSKFVQQRLFGSEVWLFSAIDSGAYAETGFVVNGTAMPTDYTGSKYSVYSARVLFGSGVGKDAKLIVGSCSAKGMQRGDTLTVQPYWITPDGTTVYGEERTLTYGRFGLQG